MTLPHVLKETKSGEKICSLWKISKNYDNDCNQFLEKSSEKCEEPSSLQVPMISTRDRETETERTAFIPKLLVIVKIDRQVLGTCSAFYMCRHKAELLCNIDFGSKNESSIFKEDLSGALYYTK